MSTGLKICNNDAKQHIHFLKSILNILSKLKQNICIVSLRLSIRPSLLSLKSWLLYLISRKKYNIFVSLITTYLLWHGYTSWWFWNMLMGCWVYISNVSAKDEKIRLNHEKYSLNIKVNNKGTYRTWLSIISSKPLIGEVSINLQPFLSHNHR